MLCRSQITGTGRLRKTCVHLVATPSKGWVCSPPSGGHDTFSRLLLCPKGNMNMNPGKQPAPGPPRGPRSSRSSQLTGRRFPCPGSWDARRKGEPSTSACEGHRRGDGGMAKRTVCDIYTEQHVDDASSLRDTEAHPRCLTGEEGTKSGQVTSCWLLVLPSYVSGCPSQRSLEGMFSPQSPRVQRVTTPSSVAQTSGSSCTTYKLRRKASLAHSFTRLRGCVF